MRPWCTSVIFVIAFFAIMAVPALAVGTITAHGDVNLIPTANDYNAGGKIAANKTMNRTNSDPWVVTVKSLNANLGQSDDLTYTKPLSDLLWKLSSGSTWTAMTTSDVTVTSGGFAGGSGSFNVDYKLLLSWPLDKPGTYTTTLQYTITT